MKKMKTIILVLLLFMVVGCKLEMRHVMPDGTVITAPYRLDPPGKYYVDPETGRRYSWE